MNINLYIVTLEIANHQGFCVITAYNSSQALEIASDFWQGYEDYDGKISEKQVPGLILECSVNSSLKVIQGNSLSEILGMQDNLGVDKEIYIIGDYKFDTVRQNLIYKDGTIESLTTKENELLSILLSKPNKIIERDFILEKIWLESNYYNSRSMDVYITKLRKHFSKDERIELLNIHGKGFKFIIP